MIKDRKFAVLEDVDGDFEGVDASLSLDDMDLIFSIVSENFYSDIEGSIVRELASNCVDSHTEARVTDPILIKYSDDEGTEYISFIDVGTGLNPERFKEVYMKYFKSTKRESNEYVGFFGIGSKSPLGYTDSFEVITRAEGVEYHYVVGKSETGKPRADLLNIKDTTERNGTEVKIVIENGDYHKFKKAIEKQLIYFDNVYVDGFDIDNGYNIVESDTFKYRYNINDSSHPYEFMHISFGKVVYPINWTALGRKEIKLPLGVKFEIGELQVTNNREQIVYSDESKELINQRIERVLDDIRRIYNEQNSQELSLDEYLKIRNRHSKTVKLGLHLVTIPTHTERIVHEDGSVEYKEIDLIEGLNVGSYKNFVGTPIVIPDRPFFFYKIHDYFGERTVNKRTRSVNRKIGNDLIDDLFKFPTLASSSYYLVKNKNLVSNKVNKYLLHKQREETRKTHVTLIREINNLTFEDYNLGLDLKGSLVERNKIRKQRENYIKAIRRSEGDTGWYRYPSIESVPYITEEWNKTKLFKFYKKVMEEELLPKMEDYDSVLNTFEYKMYLESIKKVRHYKRQEGIINAYDLDVSEEIKLDLKSIENFKGIIIYSFRGDTKRLRPLYESIEAALTFPKGSNSIRAYMVGKTFFKHFQHNPYFMSVDEFMTNGNSILRKMVTAFIVKRRYETIKDNTGLLFLNLDDISSKIHKKGTKLDSFIRHYERSINVLSREVPEMMQEMVDIATSQNWIIPHYIQDLEPIEEFYRDLELFKYINQVAFTEEKGKEKIIEYLKMKKKKLDAIYYFIPTKEEQKILDYAEELQLYKNELERMHSKNFNLSNTRGLLRESPYFN